MKTKTPPKFFGITLYESLDSVARRFSKTRNYIIDSHDDPDPDCIDIIKERLGFVRRCNIAIVDSFIEIVKTEENDAIDLYKLGLKVKRAIDELGGFTTELMLIALMSNDDQSDRLETLLKDIHYFDDDYITELRNY